MLPWGEKDPLPEAQLPLWRVGISSPCEQLPGEGTGWNGSSYTAQHVLGEELGRASHGPWGCASCDLAPSSGVLVCRRTKEEQHCNISKADSVQAHGWMLSFFLPTPPLMLQGVHMALEQPVTLLEILCTALP